MQGLIFNLMLYLSYGSCIHFTTNFPDVHRFSLPERYWPIKIRTNPLQCETNEECQNYIENSICEENVCVCSSSTFLSSDGTQCLNEVKEFGSPCKDNIQCSKLLLSGGACINNFCKCKSGYHYLKGYCWKNSPLRSPCTQREQCYSDYEYIGLECKDKFCQCRSNYYERLNKGCRRKRKNGESCNLDNDCANENSKCQNRICSGTKLYQGNGTIVQSEYQTFKETEITENGCPRGSYELNGNCFLELGQKCSENEECTHIIGAICLDQNVCACEPPFRVASENNRKCLKVSLGQVDDITRSSCEEDVQCNVFGENSQCSNKRCACKIGSYWDQTQKYCWSLKLLGDDCLDDRDCHPKEKHAVCDTKTKKCTCEKGYHEKNNSCKPNAIRVGDHCEEDEECLFPHSKCDENSEKCICREHYNVENGLCIPGIKSSCKSDADCGHLKNTKCVQRNDTTSKQCLCIDNHIESEDNKYCLASAQYKENCTESFQCQYNLGEFGECRKGVCLCNTTAHYSCGRCYKSTFLGELCTRRLECYSGNDTSSVICLKGFCACNYGYTPVDKRLCLFANSATMKSYTLLLMVLLLLLLLRN